MAARRTRKNALLPQNLYTDKKGNKVYFKYRHPIAKTWHSMGTCRAEAIAAARELNSRLMGEPDLVRSVLGLTGRDMEYLVKRFKEEKLPEKRYTPDVKRNWGYWLNRIQTDLGERTIESIDVEFIASYLDQNFTRHSYGNHRKVLKELFKFAVNKGLYPSDRMNPAEVTYSKPVEEKIRERMTIEQFIAVHKDAPEWLKIAMELSLLTLQGRSEVLNMRFDDYQDGRIKVIRKKVQKHEHSHLEISSSELAKIIERARESGIPSPFIVHRRPGRKVSAKGRKHWTQITPDYLTKEFSRLVDSLDIFKKIPLEKRPTFHEIRSLGSWLYKQEGYDNNSYVRPLMAHADERMTKKYQSGHETIWIPVSADLNLDQIVDTDNQKNHHL